MQPLFYMPSNIPPGPASKARVLLGLSLKVEDALRRKDSG